MPRTDDETPGRLGPSGAVAHGGLAPRGLRRHPGRGFAFATTMRMVARVHDDTSDLGPLAHVPGTAGLAEVLVLVVEVADLADGGHALHRDASHLARRQPDGGELAFLGQQLGGDAGGPDDLAALAGHQLDVVDGRAERDVGQRQRVADARPAIRTGDDDVTDLQAVRQEHVALLAVAVVEQPDARRPIGVVLDRGEARRDAQLVALEVDLAVMLLLPAAAMANGQPTGVVAPGAAGLRLEQGLVRLLGGDLLEGRASHLPEPRRGGRVTAKRHRQTPSKNSIFWPGARVTMALRHGVVKPTIRPRRVPRRFSLGLVVRTLTATTVTASFLYSSSTAALIWILLACSWTANVYLPRPDSSIVFSLMTGRRMISGAVKALTRPPPSCRRRTRTRSATGP